LDFDGKASIAMINEICWRGRQIWQGNLNIPGDTNTNRHDEIAFSTDYTPGCVRFHQIKILTEPKSKSNFVVLDISIDLEETVDDNMRNIGETKKFMCQFCFNEFVESLFDEEPVDDFDDVIVNNSVGIVDI
jgi:hypothetical protein